MSGSRTSLAKKSSHGSRKNLKAPKKHHMHHRRHRTRSRPVPEKKPPPADGNRLVFPRSKLTGVFEDNCSRIPPIDTAMPKEDLMPFWCDLNMIDNYDTTKITQETEKRGKIGCLACCIFFVIIIIVGIVAVPWLIAVTFFIGVCTVMSMLFFIQKAYFNL